MSRKTRPYPQFRDGAEERQFWETHDSTGYVDWSKAERVRLPNLKRSTKFAAVRPGFPNTGNTPA
jgi:hypothetical protein